MNYSLKTCALVLLLLAPFVIISCGEGRTDESSRSSFLTDGGSSLNHRGAPARSPSSSSASKLYVGGDSGAQALAGVVATDDLGRTMLGITNTEGGSDLVMVIVTTDAGIVKVWVSVSHAGVPTGMPVLAQFEDGSSFTFSSYTSSTVDSTFTTASGVSSTITGVDITRAVARTEAPSASDSPSTTLQSDIAWSFFRNAREASRIALCPPLVGFAAGSDVLAAKVGTAGCAWVNSNITSLPFASETLFNQAYRSITPTECAFAQIAAGSVAECAQDAATKVKAEGVYIGVDGTISSAAVTTYHQAQQNFTRQNEALAVAYLALIADETNTGDSAIALVDSYLAALSSYSAAAATLATQSEALRSSGVDRSLAAVSPVSIAKIGIQADDVRSEIKTLVDRCDGLELVARAQCLRGATLAGIKKVQTVVDSGSGIVASAFGGVVGTIVGGGLVAANLVAAPVWAFGIAGGVIGGGIWLACKGVSRLIDGNRSLALSDDEVCVAGTFPITPGVATTVPMFDGCDVAVSFEGHDPAITTNVDLSSGEGVTLTIPESGESSGGGTTDNSCITGSWAGTITCEGVAGPFAVDMVQSGSQITLTSNGQSWNGTWNGSTILATNQAGNDSCANVGHETWSVTGCSSATYSSTIDTTCAGFGSITSTCSGSATKQ